MHNIERLFGGSRKISRLAGSYLADPTRPADTPAEQYGKVATLGAIVGSLFAPRRLAEIRDNVREGIFHRDERDVVAAEYGIGHQLIRQATGTPSAQQLNYWETHLPNICFVTTSKMRRTGQPPITRSRFMYRTHDKMRPDQLLGNPALEVSVLGQYSSDVGGIDLKLLDWSYANGLDEQLSKFLADPLPLAHAA